MIVYANSASRTVFLETPAEAVPGTLTVLILKDGEQVHEVLSVAYDATTGRYSFNLPLFLSLEDAEYTVRWEFDFVEDGQTYPYKRDTKVQVVTPYVPFSELKELYGIELTDADEEQLALVEQSVRAFIESYTGQSFAPQHEIILVKSEGPEILLPKRLISLHANSPILNYPYRIENDGWVLNLLTPTYYQYEGVIVSPPPISFDIKRDAYEVVSSRPRRYAAKKTIQIDGIWGYERVPNPIKEATYLLIQDFLSPDSIYRDKYLTSMTAADWRIQFNSGAWRGTGNARVDQLLSDYKVRDRWVIV